MNNDLAIYSTSVASGASIETLKPSNNVSSPLSSSPVKNNDTSKSKPSSWADLFRSQSASNSQPYLAGPTVTPAAVIIPVLTQAPTPASQTQTTSPTKKSHAVTSSIARTHSGTQISSMAVAAQQNGTTTTKSNSNPATNNYYSRTNYQVYNSNGGESKSLDGSQEISFFFSVELK